MKQTITIISIILLTANSLTAQYAYASNLPDNDSINCLMDISVYKEFQKMKLYDKAIEAWAKTYDNCPGVKKILYQDGVKFLRYLIKNEQDNAKKKILVDSLMHVYDARIKYFGQAAYVKGRKGMDLYRYDKSRTDEARQMLSESVNQLDVKSSPQVLLVLMYATENLFNKQKLTKTEVSETYFTCIELLDKKLNIEKSTKKIKQIHKVKDLIEDIYAKGHFANCTDLEDILVKKFHADSTNIELILRIQKVLKSANCVHSDLYYKTALKLHDLHKNADNSYVLAGFYLKREQVDNAVVYLNEAIDLEKSDSLKAIYCVDLGTIYYTRLEKYQEAQNYAKKALKLKPDNGKAFILLGDIYAAYSPFYGKNEFEHTALYWLAVDQYKKAKAVDASLSKTADEKIAYYRERFPTAENAFFYGYTKGQIYKFDGWIKETTEVRARQGK